MSLKTHRSIGVHTTVLEHFRLSLLKRSKTIKLNVVKQVNYVHATNTRACDILGHRFHFDASVHTHTICMRIRFDRCVFDENAQRISVEGTPKRIEMDAFSKENALKRTKPKSYELDFQKQSFVGFHMARDFVARGRPLRGQTRHAPLAKRSTCSKSTYELERSRKF